MKDISWRAWPKKYPDWKVGTNVIPICILGRHTGLVYNKESKSLSVMLSHPLADWWLSILKPIWAEKNEGKCLICHGTGWDGIGYTLCCVGCSPSVGDLMVDKHAGRKRDENGRLITE